MAAQLRYYFTPQELRDLADASGENDILFTFEMGPKDDGTGDIASALTAEALNNDKSATGNPVKGCPHPCPR